MVGLHAEWRGGATWTRKPFSYLDSSVYLNNWAADLNSLSLLHACCVLTGAILAHQPLTQAFTLPCVLETIAAPSSIWPITIHGRSHDLRQWWSPQ